MITVHTLFGSFQRISNLPILVTLVQRYRQWHSYNFLEDLNFRSTVAFGTSNNRAFLRRLQYPFQFCTKLTISEKMLSQIEKELVQRGPVQKAVTIQQVAKFATILFPPCWVGLAEKVRWVHEMGLMDLKGIRKAPWEPDDRGQSNARNGPGSGIKG
ncbi:hypothetical protein PISL3812_01128 [Talaromyces islandicus]|uniref:Uncharacterized protein n=1 Tax=Talaromyces islandicus TaxID=28573 RepID=A0A0U1LLT2_TALIS|nr:hypothetical protein PISL3812_01128 [Talaromyces islandicus]